MQITVEFLLKTWYTGIILKILVCGVMLMRKLEYTFKNDTLFKMLFTKHKDLLKKLVAALLGIPVQDIQQFVVRNEEMPPEALGEKFCRLDINMMVNSQQIDLEIQVAYEGDYPERVMLYWAREFSTALPAGENYSMLPRTIIISIIDFKLFNCSEYHSFFQPLEVTRDTLLSDKMGFHFFELKKLPKDIPEDDTLLLWLSLFNAETEEDLEKIKRLEVPEMEQAINAYHTITASSEFRELERLREKARHDEAQALYHAKQEGKQEGIQEGIQKGASERSIDIAKSMIADGEPLSKIMHYTGLSLEELEKYSR